MQTDFEYIRLVYDNLLEPGAEIKVGDGWGWLLAGLCESIREYALRHPLVEPVRIRRIVQRLGYMSVEFTGGDEHIHEIVTAVQLLSVGVCQECGSIEHVGGTFGTALHTLCRNCWRLDERFHNHNLAPNHYTAAVIKKIKKATMHMPGNWFRRTAEKILQSKG